MSMSRLKVRRKRTARLLNLYPSTQASRRWNVLDRRAIDVVHVNVGAQGVVLKQERRGASVICQKAANRTACNIACGASRCCHCGKSERHCQLLMATETKRSQASTPGFAENQCCTASPFAGISPFDNLDSPTDLLPETTILLVSNFS